MKNLLLLLGLLVILVACQPSTNGGQQMVKNNTELAAAITDAQAGDEIVMANGVWEDIEIRFTGKGAKGQPIMLRAETPGEVMIQGKSDLKFGKNVTVSKMLLMISPYLNILNARSNNYVFRNVSQ